MAPETQIKSVFPELFFTRAACKTDFYGYLCDIIITYIFHMTKLQALLGASVLGLAAAASAQNPGTLTVSFPEGTDTLYVAPVPIKEIYGDNSRAAIKMLRDTLIVTGTSSYALELDPSEAMSVVVGPAGKRPVVVYAAPGETLAVDFNSPVCKMTGSPLVEGISQWEAVSDSIMAVFRALPKPVSDEQRQAVINDYNSRVKAIVDANLDNALGVAMLSYMQDEDDMIAAYNSLKPGAVNSILAPKYIQIGNYIELTKARRAAAEFIQVGKPAPDFTLPAPDGTQISLSDFRGKWVMLDFWGSWCGWCIKGIPQMKEQWQELKDRDVVFLSIDCNDTRDTWLDALKKYELPWVNVWSDPETPENSSVEVVYAVQGYPTKLVINPEGNIALIVVGEDPSFYDKLRALLPAQK